MWRVIPGQSLRYRQWEDEAVLYNDVSGATHLLGAAALCLLEALRPAPGNAMSLSAALRDAFEVDEDALADELAILLDDLVRLDLIEPCPC
ncbi:HPr-rel-A system PqqD family peptide chaperone [Massilia sp. UMI-21]|nr:HPr-rel-A system PqqD family peptide chaperone [Massilia sp. UMI-21]